MSLFQCPTRASVKTVAVPLLIALLLVFTSLLSAPAQAQGPAPTTAECLACHADPTLSLTLPSGEPLSLFVDEKHFGASIHSQNNITCAQCHTNITGFPHPEFKAQDRREVTLTLSAQCATCHEDVATQAHDGIHAQLLAQGNRNAAVCTDCHTAHEVGKANEPRERIPQSCAQCHSTIAANYFDSVHGAALLENSNPDVPTCVDCHGVHSIEDPRTTQFRLRSPKICADCHTDANRMSKYGISTNVLNTYVADFHGTTVELFAKQSPDAATNKPVCYDCHGIHDIKAIDDPDSSVFKGNLLHTCQQCHPNATTEAFVGSWTSHYIATPDKNPLIYYINLFYSILIPVTVGGLGGFVALDVFHRVRQRFTRPKM